MYNYSTKGSLIKNLDGKVYSVIDLLQGEEREIPTKELKKYSHTPQSCLISDEDGKLYNIIDLLKGFKNEVTPKELKDYHYSPRTCLVQNPDGSTSNIIDAIFNFSPSEGEGADSKRLRRVEKEITEARTGADGIVYGTLDGRLDFEYKRLEDRSKSTYDGMVDILSSSYLLMNSNEKLHEKTNLIKEENEGIKETNEIQDDMIDTTMMATDEIFNMIEEMLPEAAKLIEGGSKMIDLYVAMIQRGLKTIDQIPTRYRAKVQEIIDALEN